MVLPSNVIFSMEVHLQNVEVMVQFQGCGSKVKVTAVKKAVACNSKTTGRKLLGLYRNVCYYNAQSNTAYDVFT